MRRAVLITALNSDRSSLPSVSSLELITRYTSTIWSFAHQHGVNPRPGAPLPPAINIQTDSEPSTKTPGPEQEVSLHLAFSVLSFIPSKVVPPFDLQHFLDVKA
jgi:hypothetical protein